MKCDFCSSANVVGEIPAASFVYPGILSNVAGSEGGWMTCGPCGVLFRSGQLRRLAERVTEGYVADRRADGDVIEPEAVAMLRDELHRVFCKLREYQT